MSRLQLSLSMCGKDCLHEARVAVHANIASLLSKHRTLTSNIATLLNIPQTGRNSTFFEKRHSQNIKEYVSYLREDKKEVILKLRHMKNLELLLSTGTWDGKFGIDSIVESYKSFRFEKHKRKSKEGKLKVNLDVDKLLLKDVY